MDTGFTCESCLYFDGVLSRGQAGRHHRMTGHAIMGSNWEWVFGTPDD